MLFSHKVQSGISCVSNSFQKTCYFFFALRYNCKWLFGEVYIFPLTYVEIFPLLRIQYFIKIYLKFIFLHHILTYHILTSHFLHISQFDLFEELLTIPLIFYRIYKTFPITILHYTSFRKYLFSTCNKEYQLLGTYATGLIAKTQKMKMKFMFMNLNIIFVNENSSELLNSLNVSAHIMH